MRLPGGERAIVPLARVSDYLLNPTHETGKHKARVFLAALGLTAAEAGIVRSWLVDLAREGDATRGNCDAHGERFAISGMLSYKGREARVRTAWIVRPGRTEPEFLTAFVE